MDPSGIGTDDAVALDRTGLHFANGDDASPLLLARAKQLKGDRNLREHDHVGKKHGESLLSDHRLYTGNRMGETEGSLLPNVDNLRQACEAANVLAFRGLLTLFEEYLQLWVASKMGLWKRLVASQDKDDRLNTGGCRFFDGVPDERLPGDGEHLLGNGLCGWEHARARAG